MDPAPSVLPRNAAASTGTASPDSAARLTTLREWLIAIRERIVYTLPIATFLALAWGYYHANETPLYASTARVQVERPERVVVTQEVVETSVNSDIDLNTHLQTFASEELRQRVLRSLTPDERQNLRPAGAPADAAPNLGRLSVATVARSLLIQVTVTHPSAQAAAFIANRYVRVFLDYQLEILDRKNAYAVDYLQKRSEELLRAANTAERELQDYMRRHDLVSLDNSTNLTATRLTVVSNALQQKRLERLSLQELCDQVARQQTSGGNLLEIRAISGYSGVSEYRQQLDNLRQAQSLLGETYLRRHPKMIAVAQEIAAAQTQLNAAIALAIADLHASRARLEESEKNLEAEYANQEKALFRLRDLAVEYKGLESRAQVAKNSYATILARLNETTTTKALGKVPLRLLDTAQPSGKPVSPDPNAVVRSSVGIGLIVLVGLTLAVAYFDDRIRSSHDIETLLGQNLLGIITHIDNGDARNHARIVLDQRHASAMEPFMSLHASVGMFSKYPEPKILLVTSTLPGEGKTFVSTNLAASFSYHGKRTLLVDCDIRRPVIHKNLDQPNDAGLLRWFECGADLTVDPLANPALGINRITPHLSLLTSGGHTSHPTPMFETPQFAQLFRQLRAHFDVIVIDTPPLGAVADSIYIAKVADEAIYLSRFNRASRKHIRLSLHLLSSSGCRILGMVLNGIRRNRLPYYTDYRYYGSYERYHA